MKIFLALAIVSFLNLSLIQPTEPDITGEWLSSRGNDKIDIIKNGDVYYGKLIWVKNGTDGHGNPLTDIHNPKAELRSRPLIGLEIFSGLKYRGRNVWAGGKVYDRRSGKTYNCQMTLKNDNRLDIRSFFGLALLGKTESWKRPE